MRIRSTKPEFWRSKTMSRFDWATRLVFKGLESYVDDNGVGKDDLALIAADVFPRDLSSSPHETLRQLAEALERLAAAGLIVRYEMDDEELVYIDDWKKWQYIQHPKAGRFPRPDGTKEYKEEVSRASYRQPHEEFMKPPAECMTGTGEQGNRGTGEKDDHAPAKQQEPLEVEAVVVPEHIDTPNKPTKRYASDAAKTVVRQCVPGYPRTTIDRLAVQVEKLTQEGHTDALIREALKEWEQRPNCDKPEFLPTVLGDLVKKSRQGPTKVHKLRGYAQLAQEVREQEQSESRKELA